MTQTQTMTPTTIPAAFIAELEQYARQYRSQLESQRLEAMTRATAYIDLARHYPRPADMAERNQKRAMFWTHRANDLAAKIAALDSAS